MCYTVSVYSIKLRSSERKEVTRSLHCLQNSLLWGTNSVQLESVLLTQFIPSPFLIGWQLQSNHKCMHGCATDIDNIHSFSGLVWAFSKLKYTPQTWYRKLILCDHIAFYYWIFIFSCLQIKLLLFFLISFILLPPISWRTSPLYPISPTLNFQNPRKCFY